MKKKEVTLKKLQLNREALRALEQANLAVVHGGAASELYTCRPAVVARPTFAEPDLRYASGGACAGKPESAACPCPPWSDKDGSTSNCGEWGSISANGCWYM